MSNRLTILLYHGVTDAPSPGIENFSKKHVTAQDFDQQMSFISQHCKVLSMDDVVELHQSNQPYPEKAVAVTFDDGFRNNFTVAAPILDKYNVPTTFYITSGIIGTKTMFWVDKLEDCINNSKQEVITVTTDQQRSYTLTTDQEKIDAVVSIKAFCKLAQDHVKDGVIAQVIEQTGIQPSVDHASNYEKMSWDELRGLDAYDFCTIGGHSLKHDILSKISGSDNLRYDIETSIEMLERELGHSIVHYSYPEGQAEHYNEEVIQVLKDNHIVCSPSAIDGVNYDGQYDLFNLRRVMVGFMGIPFPSEF